MRIIPCIRAALLRAVLGAAAGAVSGLPLDGSCEEPADLPLPGLTLQGDTAGAVDSAATLTLSRALALALELSPDLASFASDVQAHRAQAFQAGLRPNPVMEGGMEEFGGSGSLSGMSAAESSFSVSQTFELRGKRAKRARAAEIDVEIARWQYESARRRVRAGVATAFAGVLAAQQRVVLSEELVEIAEASRESVQRLIRAGSAPEIEGTRAEVESGITRIEASSARRELTAARVVLAASWGAESASFGRAAGDLFSVQPPPALAVLRARLAESPDLLRWEREIALRESEVELVDALGTPDLVARAGMKRLGELGESAFVASFSLPLALFDRNQGNRSAARSDLLRGRYQKRAAEVAMVAELTRAYQRFLAQYEEVTELRSAVLPGAQRAFEGVRSGLLQGRFRSIDVLDAQRRLFELRLRELDALRSYHAAKAELERLTGSIALPPTGEAGP